MKRRILIFAMIMALMLQNFSALAPSQASEITEDTTTKNITIENDSIISEELQQAFSTNAESYRVMIWIDDIDYDKVETMAEKATATTWEEIEAYEKQVYADAITEVAQAELTEKTSAGINTASALRSNEEIMEDNYEAVLKAADDDLKLVADEVDAYISAKRAASKSLYQVNNQQVAGNSIIKEKLEFVSSYSPMVIANLSQDEIEAIAEEEMVVGIYLDSNVENIVTGYEVKEGTLTENELSEYEVTATSSNYLKYLEYINANAAHDLGYTGDGVKVGLLDSGAIDTSGHAELMGKDVTTIGSVNNTSHSIYMARIICGSNGVAPDSTLYSASYDNGFYSQVEGLINCGVSVINMSFGWNRTDMSEPYSAREKWLDHVAYSHCVVIVCSAGNRFLENDVYIYNVCQPALAYNTITVANVDCLNDQLRNTSCYQNGASGAFKPDVASAGANVLGDEYGGTSAAAATVTGMVSILLELKPVLINHPHVTKALVIASADHIAGSDTYSSSYNAQQGAGVVDVMRAIAIVNRGQYWSGHISNNGTYSFTKTVASGSDTSTFVFVGTKRNTPSDNHASGGYTNVAMPSTQFVIFNNTGTTGLSGSGMPYSAAQLVRIPYRSGVLIKLTVNNINSTGMPYAVAWY